MRAIEAEARTIIPFEIFTIGKRKEMLAEEIRLIEACIKMGCDLTNIMCAPMRARADRLATVRAKRWSNKDRNI